MFLYHCDECQVYFPESLFLTHFKRHHTPGATISKMLNLYRPHYATLPASTDRRVWRYTGVPGWDWEQIT